MPRDIDRTGGGWSQEQLNNARIIAQVGRSLGMSQRDILIGIMTALQESTLRNLDYGDRDSLGLFQQRPSAGWGTPEQIMDPVYAATKFFQRLAQIEDRNSMELWEAAQAVQISAFPRAYAKWEKSARELLGLAGTQDTAASFSVTPQILQIPGLGTDVPTGAPGALESSPVSNPMVSAMEKILADGIGQDAKESVADEALGAEAADEEVDFSKWSIQEMLMETGRGIQGSPLQFMGRGRATGLRDAVLNMARKFVGTPYVWGGAEPGGFDCSGLIQYVLNEMGIQAPRLAYEQANWGKQTSINNIKPGDLVFWGNSRRTQGNHIAFYLGNGKILEAPRPGLSVRIRSLGQWDKDDGAIGIALDY